MQWNWAHNAVKSTHSWIFDIDLFGNEAFYEKKHYFVSFSIHFFIHGFNLCLIISCKIWQFNYLIWVYHEQKFYTNEIGNIWNFTN